MALYSADLICPQRTRRAGLHGAKPKWLRPLWGGLITDKEACETYDLTADELTEWISAVKSHGPAALRVTALQKYRQP